MEIAERLTALRSSVPEHVTLVAVSKTKPVPVLMQAYLAGQRIFGENRVQELTAKHPLMPPETVWHFIGHLQTNKVKFIAPFVNLIHSVDSLNLLREINREALRNRRVIDCLLQFHIASEETKFGLNPAEAKAILESHEYRDMDNVRITGVMGMASFTDDMILVRQEFRQLRAWFDDLRSGCFSGESHFREISMGMTGDYRIAIEEGSTMIRLGTAIFGER